MSTQHHQLQQQQQSKGVGGFRVSIMIPNFENQQQQESNEEDAQSSTTVIDVNDDEDDDVVDDQDDTTSTICQNTPTSPTSIIPGVFQELE